MRNLFSKITAYFLAFLLITGGLTSCSTTPEYRVSALDELVREMNDEPNFTVVLYDMQVERNLLSPDKYSHQYQIIVSDSSKMDEKKTGWMPVSKEFFNLHVNNMGMEIATKTNGKLNKAVAPAGYSQYVGNPQYGQWSQRNGSSFWEFYGQYAMMSTLFNLARPVDRYSYDDYNRNYRDVRRPYYGTAGKTTYGTSSTLKTRGTTSAWGRSSASSTFKSNVNSRVSRSKSSTKPRKSRSTSSRRMRMGRRR